MRLYLPSVLEEIKDNKHFKLVERGDFVKVSYRFNAPFVFDTPLKRELRGVTFSKKTGRVVSRPFHKFFNVDESEESKKEKLKGRFLFREKLDGTMVHPVPEGEDFFLVTQKSFDSPQTRAAEELLRSDDKLLRFTKECLSSGLTPIFEFVSPRFQIVLPYEEEALVLTEIRDNETGAYLLEDVAGELEEEGIRLPKSFYGSLDELERELESRENVEGFVLKSFTYQQPFPLFVKVKSPLYRERHYAFTYLHNVPDHKLFLAYSEGKLDEILPKVTNQELKEQKLKRLERLTSLYGELLKAAEGESVSFSKFREHFEKLEIPRKLPEKLRELRKKGRDVDGFLTQEFYKLLKEGKVVLKGSR